LVNGPSTFDVLKPTCLYRARSTVRVLQLVHHCKMLLIWRMRYEAHALDEWNSAAVDQHREPYQCAACRGTSCVVWMVAVTTFNVFGTTSPHTACPLV
jgi:hypothetical protein